MTGNSKFLTFKDNKEIIEIELYEDGSCEIEMYDNPFVGNFRKLTSEETRKLAEFLNNKDNNEL